MELLNEIYTIEGRLNRLSYLKYQVLWTIISTVIGFIISLTGGIISTSSESIVVTVPMAIWSIIAFVGNIMLSIRRLHDLNKSGWFLLIWLIPFVNIIFLLYMCLAPGTVGYNKYGADPLQE